MKRVEKLNPDDGESSSSRRPAIPTPLPEFKGNTGVRAWLLDNESNRADQFRLYCSKNPPPLKIKIKREFTQPQPPSRRRRPRHHSLTDLEDSVAALRDLGVSKIPPPPPPSFSDQSHYLNPQRPQTPPPFPHPFVSPDQQNLPQFYSYDQDEQDPDFKDFLRSHEVQKTPNHNSSKSKLPKGQKDREVPSLMAWEEAKDAINHALSTLYFSQSSQVQAMLRRPFMIKSEKGQQDKSKELIKIFRPAPLINSSTKAINKDPATESPVVKGAADAAASPPDVVQDSPSNEVDKNNNDKREEAPWITEDLGISYLRSCMGRVVNPIFELKKQRAFRDLDQIKVKRLLRPWPTHAGLRGNQPIFTLNEEDDKYFAMKCRLDFFYAILLGERGRFPVEHLRAGYAVVFADGDRSTGFEGKSYERALILTLLHPKVGSKNETYVRLYLVDQGTVIIARAGMILFLCEPFDLPPRAHHLKMLGLRTFYSQVLTLHGLLCPASGIWEGPLQAQKLPSGWIMWSWLVTKKEYTYGISEYILHRIVAELPRGLEPGLVLPGHVVHSEDNGDFWFQINSPYSKQLKWVGEKTVANKLKAVESPDALYKGARVLAPTSADGYFSLFRAQVVQIMKEEEKVKVFFLDYGNTDVVSVGQVVWARNFHPLYEILPATATRMRLVNLKGNKNRIMDTTPFWNFVDGEEPDHWVRVCGMSEEDGTILVELVKSASTGGVKALSGPRPSTSSSSTSADKGFELPHSPPPSWLDLTLPHFFFDGSTLKEEGQSQDKKSIAAANKIKRTLPPSGVKHRPDMAELSEGLTTLRYDLINNNNGYGYGGNMGQDPSKQALFLKPGRFILFQIKHVDLDTGVSYLQPAKIAPFISDLEKELEAQFFQPHWETTTLGTRFWTVGSVFAIHSLILARVVRAQVLKVNRDNTYGNFHVELVDYGIKETCSAKNLRHMSFEQCQLPACGVRAILYNQNADESSPPLSENRLKLDDVVKITDYTLVARLVEEFGPPRASGRSRMLLQNKTSNVQEDKVPPKKKDQTPPPPKEEVKKKEGEEVPALPPPPVRRRIQNNYYAGSSTWKVEIRKEFSPKDLKKLVSIRRRKKVVKK